MLLGICWKQGVEIIVVWWQKWRINSFIDELEVVDIPVVGNMFTWYNSDCRPKSGLDRFLGSEGIISRWKILGQVTGLRDILDHKPIWIK